MNVYVIACMSVHDDTCASQIRGYLLNKSVVMCCGSRETDGGLKE